LTLLKSKAKLIELILKCIVNLSHRIIYMNCVFKLKKLLSAIEQWVF